MKGFGDLHYAGLRKIDRTRGIIVFNLLDGSFVIKNLGNRTSERELSGLRRISLGFLDVNPRLNVSGYHSDPPAFFTHSVPVTQAPF